MNDEKEGTFPIYYVTYHVGAGLEKEAMACAKDPSDIESMLRAYHEKNPANSDYPGLSHLVAGSVRMTLWEGQEGKREGIMPISKYKKSRWFVRN